MVIFDLNKLMSDVEPESVNTVMYTSGTTDNPKGITFTQNNLMSKRFARALALPNISSEDIFLCYLPLFHTFGRFFELMGSVFWGANYCFAQSPSFNSLLSSIGLGGYFKNFLVSFITSNPLELAKALKSCEALTTLIANSLSEAVFMMIQKDKGLSGDGYTFIRNALGGVVKDTKFVNSLEKQLSGIVCELFGKMNDKASGVYDKLKTGMADSGGLGGLLDKGKTALASAV